MYSRLRKHLPAGPAGRGLPHGPFQIGEIGGRPVFLIAGASDEVDDGDGDEDANGGGGNDDPDGTGKKKPAAAKGKNDDEEKQRLLAREKRQGRRAERRKIEEQLGMTVDEALEKLGATGEDDDPDGKAKTGKDTKVDPALAREREAAAKDRREAAKLKHETKVERLLLKANANPEKIVRLAKMVIAETEVGADDDEITDAISDVKDDVPGMFLDSKKPKDDDDPDGDDTDGETDGDTKGGRGRGTSSVPSGTGTARKPVKGGSDAAKRGEERAKARNEANAGAAGIADLIGAGAAKT